MTPEQKAELLREIAGRQDGNLTGTDPINDIIKNAINAAGDRSDITDSIQYAIDELHKALRKVRDFQIWISTDPDTNQYRLYDENSFGSEFTFKQDSSGKTHHEATINLNDYQQARINSIIQAYGYSFNEADYLYYDSSGNEITREIVCECIFETEAPV